MAAARSAPRFVVALLAAASASLSAAASAQSAGHGAPTAARPNLVVILADDLGYGDVGFDGATVVKTPNLDRLAAGGLRFTSGYCSASTCTPTRFSLLTGRYAFRQPGTGVLPPNGAALIRPGTETIASMLHRAGYATAAIGKWHLGLGNEPQPDWNGELVPGPLEIGFDTCFLLPTTNDRVPCVFVEDHRVAGLDPADPLWVGMQKPSRDEPTGADPDVRRTLRMDWSVGHHDTVHNGIGRIGFFTGGTAARWRDEDLADTWVARATRFVEEHADEPFFLYFAPHDIHVPRMPNERFQGVTELGYRGDAIVELDWSVGRLLAVLDRLHLADKTLVVFCSDNGPVLDDGYRDGAVEKLGDHRPAGRYRGGKYTVWEGGTRTPFVTRWPGRIAPGVSDAMVCTIDLAASFAALTGQDVPAGAFPDSVDVLPALLGEDGAEGRTELVQQGNSADCLGFRVGDWKLVRRVPRNRGPSGEALTPEYSLYDIRADPGETEDVLGRHPERARRMIDRLDAVIEAGSSHRPAVR